MANLKGLLFSQYAGEGLNQLVEEMQKKYKPKKGRRFHHNNITYEISRPALTEEMLEFEISSKIPQDELSNPKKEMKTYFQGIKKNIRVKKHNPVSVEMENIVWDPKKETEKARDYVKLLYRYPLEDLYDNQAIIKKCEEIATGAFKETLPDIPGTLTTQGKLVLVMVRDTIQEIGRKNLETLIEANQSVRANLKN